MYCYNAKWFKLPLKFIHVNTSMHSYVFPNIEIFAQISYAEALDIIHKISKYFCNCAVMFLQNKRITFVKYDTRYVVSIMINDGLHFNRFV